MDIKQYKMLIKGEFRGEPTYEVLNPFDNSVVSRVPTATTTDVDDAIASAAEAFEITKKFPSYLRSELLHNISEKLKSEEEKFALSICQEAGKPISLARIEVQRALTTLKNAAEEAQRIEGSLLPLDKRAGFENKWAIERRFPIGPVSAISPFNFPLNLGLHKVAPALAAGCTVVWKPSFLTPGAASMFAEIFVNVAQEIGYPLGALNVVTPSDEAASALVTDERIKLLSFTGSAKVGWELKAKAGKKKVTLELGGNAAVIIDETAEMQICAEKCTASGFGYAGQTCISTQRIFVHKSKYDEFLSLVLASVKALRADDPEDHSTDVGPMISEKEASRLESWVIEAVHGGAVIHCGGQRNGLMFEPTVMTNVTPDMKLFSEEAFGPIISVQPFSEWDEAIALVNNSKYGLQCGIFTRRQDRIFQAFAEIEVGAVIVNDPPSFREDSMPYGGIKDSGLGREGVRSAIMDMTEPKLLVIEM